jgi:hypothetical protein
MLVKALMFRGLARAFRLVLVAYDFCLDAKSDHRFNTRPFATRAIP